MNRTLSPLFVHVVIVVRSVDKERLAEIKYRSVTYHHSTIQIVDSLPVVGTNNRITNGFTAFIAVIETTTSFSTLATFATFATVIKATLATFASVAEATVVTTTTTVTTRQLTLAITSIHITRTIIVTIETIGTIEITRTIEIIIIETRSKATSVISESSFPTLSSFPTFATVAATGSAAGFTHF